MKGKKYLYVAVVIRDGRRIVNEEGREIHDVKIGITDNPEQREKQLMNTKSPFKTAIAHLVELLAQPAEELESFLHETFADINTEGEYFESYDANFPERVLNVIRNSRFEHKIKGISESAEKELQIVKKKRDNRRAIDTETLLDRANNKIINMPPSLGKEGYDITITGETFKTEFGSFSRPVDVVNAWCEKEGLTKRQAQGINIWTRGKVDGLTLEKFVELL